MRTTLARVATIVATAAASLAAASGVAAAEPQDPATWLLPGVDAGALLGPTVGLPTDALAPLYGVLTLLAG
ncbi:hypothetical protein ACFS2C_15725 [Prauserella oleivorans]|uniref:Uncharacterized protein n=1 Tax=Prauserella oleivorans TaxID=1478153 RepID=A0ABW5WC63_9PSEU